METLPSDQQGGLTLTQLWGLLPRLTMEVLSHIYSSQATIFYFSDTVHFSARSLTYEMLKWAVLMDHYYISGLLYSPMSGLSLKTLRFEDRCSHLCHFQSSHWCPVLCQFLSHWTDGVSDGLYCMVMTLHFILCYGYYWFYNDSCDMY